MAHDDSMKSKKIHMLLVLILVVGLVNLVALMMKDTSGTTSETGLQSEMAEHAGDSCSSGANFDATVGKFRLTLSDPNVVLRILDDAYEGGPITSLSIGQCVDGQKNVIDIHPNSEISIIAHPSATAAQLRTSYEAEVGITFGREPDTTIAGVTVEVYSYSGLTNTKVLYFDNNGIGYEIEVPDDNTTTNSIVNDITSDWAFTP